MSAYIALLKEYLKKEKKKVIFKIFYNDNEYEITLKIMLLNNNLFNKNKKVFVNFNPYLKIKIFNT